jgi:ubiquitin-conjugating enzyme
MKLPKAIPKALMSKLKRKHSTDQSSISNTTMSALTTAEDFLVQRHPQDHNPTFTKPLPSASSSAHQPSTARNISEDFIADTINPEKIVIDLTQDTPPPMSPTSPDLDADWKFAMEIQAQLDAESQATEGAASSSSSSTPTLNSSKKQKITSLQGSIDFPMDIFDTDEEYAKALEAEFEFASMGQNASLLNDDKYVPLKSNDLEDAQIAQDLQAQYDSEIYFPGGNTESQSNGDQESGFQLISSFGQTLLKIRCNKCNKHVIYDESSIKQVIKTWLQNGNFNSSIRCVKCNYSAQYTCVGCGSKPKGQNTERIQDIMASWCCDRGRLFILWVLFSSPFQAVSKTKQSTKASSSSAAKKTCQAAGVGYGDNPGRKRNARDAALQINEKDPSDDLVTTTLQVVSKLLPSWDRTSSFDQNPPTELIHMLRRSVILERVGELLRNDSIENVTKRRRLYQAVVDFMTSLANHCATIKIIFEERLSQPVRQSLLAITLGEVDSHQFSKGNETLQSLSRIMQPLQIQSRSFLKQVRAVQETGSRVDTAENDADSIQICTAIIKLSDYLNTNAPQKNPQHEDQIETDEIIEQAFIEWHRDNCVDDLPDSELLSSHHFDKQANGPITPAKGRMKQLIMEIASLRTSLPPGIYVRHGSSRLDVLKALIVGPKDTPYENGLFEFDIWCPSNYPQEPPKVHFKTTGGGRAHFNPNLYPEGKVCLSLIGT